MIDKMHPLSSTTLSLFSQLKSDDTFPFEQIEPHERFKNSRSKPAGLKDMVASLEANGMLTPMIIWKVKLDDPYDAPWGEVEHRYFLIAGSRRHAGVKQIKITDPSAFDVVPVRVYEGDIQGAATINVVENLQREDLTLIEVCEYMIYMRDDLGFTGTDIARTVGKSKPWVSMVMAFYDNAHPDLIDCARKREIGLKQALLVAKKTPDIQSQIVKKYLAALKFEGKKAADDVIEDLKEPKVKVRDWASISKKYHRYDQSDISEYDGEQKAFVYGLKTAFLYCLNNDVSFDAIVDPKVEEKPPIPSDILKKKAAASKKKADDAAAELAESVETPEASVTDEDPSKSAGETETTEETPTEEIPEVGKKRKSRPKTKKENKA